MSDETTSAPRVAILATLDTKQAEADFLASALKAVGLTPVFVDTSIRTTARTVPSDQKIQLMQTSANDAYHSLRALIESGLAGAIGIGGGTGTWVCINAMQNLAFGWPKMIVTTLAYDVRASVAASDIVLMPSIADIQGLNPTLRMVLENAAAALAGMVNAPPHQKSVKPIVGITALGVTNDAVIGISNLLTKAGYEVTTFHATGMGGRAFERWITDGKLDAVIDLTTQELHGLSFGAPITCDEARMLGAANANVPQLVVPGGIDFIARGQLKTLSKPERKRPRFCHSPEYTHIRATKKQVMTTAKIMADRLNQSTAATAVIIPLGGFSIEGSRPDGAMWNVKLCKLFATTLEQNLNPEIPVIRSDAAITSPIFHQQAVTEFFKLLNLTQSKPEHP